MINKPLDGGCTAGITAKQHFSVCVCVASGGFRWRAVSGGWGFLGGWTFDGFLFQLTGSEHGLSKTTRSLSRWIILMGCANTGVSCLSDDLITITHTTRRHHQILVWFFFLLWWFVVRAIFLFGTKRVRRIRVRVVLQKIMISILRHRGERASIEFIQ